jgi:hypothetical protein
MFAMTRIQAPIEKWQLLTPVEKSYVYAKLLFFVAIFGFIFIWELYGLTRTT